MSAGHWPFAGICFQWTWVSLLPVGPWWLVSPRWSDSPYLLLVQHVFLRPAGSLTYSQTGWFALWSPAIGSFHCYPDNLLGNPPGIPPYGTWEFLHPFLAIWEVRKTLRCYLRPSFFYHTIFLSWNYSILVKKLFWDKVFSWSPNRKWGWKILYFDFSLSLYQTNSYLEI